MFLAYFRDNNQNIITGVTFPVAGIDRLDEGAESVKVVQFANSCNFILDAVLDPVPTPISVNQHPVLNHMCLISGHRTSLNPSTFDHANSIQVTSILNVRSALIADAIGLSITLSLALPELLNPLCSLLS